MKSLNLKLVAKAITVAVFAVTLCFALIPSSNAGVPSSEVSTESVAQA